MKKETKKSLSAMWLISALVVVPCILNIEMMGCCIFFIANLVGAFLTFKKYNSEFIL